MAFEGLLAKFGPTLVREISPHVVQLFSGLVERFRTDTREMKAAVDAEVLQLGRSHTGLVTTVDRHGAQIDQLLHKVDALQHTVDTLGQQVATTGQSILAGQRRLTQLLIVSGSLALLTLALIIIVLVRHG